MLHIIWMVPWAFNFYRYAKSRTYFSWWFWVWHKSLFDIEISKCSMYPTLLKATKNFARFSFHIHDWLPNIYYISCNWYIFGRDGLCKNQLKSALSPIQLEEVNIKQVFIKDLIWYINIDNNYLKIILYKTNKYWHVSSYT